MKTMVIAVSGYSGAGKSTVVCFDGIIRKKVVQVTKFV